MVVYGNAHGTNKTEAEKDHITAQDHIKLQLARSSDSSFKLLEFPQLSCEEGITNIVKNLRFRELGALPNLKASW